MSEFLFQGGYGAYVWSAYAISLLALGLTLGLTLHAWRKAKRRLARLKEAETNI